MRTRMVCAIAACMAVLAACEGGGGGPLVVGGGRPGGTQAGLLPDTTTRYTVRLAGTTYVGSTAVPGATTVYTAQETFVVTGTLVVEPTLDRSGAALSNGTNLRDVGLFVGRPVSTPVGGSIWLATNTDVYQRAQVIDVPEGLARIDLAFVTGSTTTGVLDAAADPAFYGLAAGVPALLNSFNTSTGAIAQVYRVTGGGMQLDFAGRGAEATVTGTVDVVGTGYNTIGSGRMVASLTAFVP